MIKISFYVKFKTNYVGNYSCAHYTYSVHGLVKTNCARFAREYTRLSPTEILRIIFTIRCSLHLYIYFSSLSVCLYPIHVKTAKLIGPKFCVGPHVNPEKVYEWSNFQKFASINIRFSVNFWKFWKSMNFFYKIRKIFCFCFINPHAIC